MPAAVWIPPEEFDEYRVIRPLGQGGMGTVFLAHDTLLDRVVAIKFISRLQADGKTRERFLVEARASARLAHPNVVQVHRVGLLDGQPYLVSEFVRGQSLAELDKPVRGPRILELALGLARGLAAAHERGVLHRDLKPGNAVLADDGEVKLLDFGIAKLLDPRTAPPETPAAARPVIGRDDTTLPAEPPAALLEAASAPGDTQSTMPFLEPGARAAEDLEQGGAAGAGASLTKTGAVMGTPLYMAPEVWRGEAATRRSDVYGLGCVLYELASGSPPHKGHALMDISRAAQQDDAAPVASRVSDLDARLAAVIDRCVRRDAAKRFSSATELRDALEEIHRGERRGAALPAGNPYRGLDRFEAEHRPLFFGRDREIAAVLERMRAAPFVLIAGDSGVGKSSLCRAGVLPAVMEDALGGGRSWQVITLCPGRHPEAALHAVLEGLSPSAGDDQAGGRDAPTLVAGLARQLGKTRGLVVFVDQLEELVTVAAPAEARSAAELLAELVVGAPGLRLLATARSDFLSRLTALERLGDEIPSAVHVLRPLRHEEMREAVVGPARAMGFAFESEELVSSMVHAEGALPLLQFALAEMWEARDEARAIIPAEALEAVGGVAGALARHADGVIEALRPAERAAARRILTDLVSAQGTRAQRSEDELTRGDADADRALGALVRGRLLVAREAEGGETAFEVAHEALLSGWATLRGWLDESTERRAARERLEAAVAEWERLARSPDALWSPRQLADVALIPRAEIDPRAQAFVAASERAVRQRRRTRVALAVALPLLAALSYAGIRLQARWELARRVEARVAEANSAYTRARAHAEEVERLRAEAFKLFERGETEPAERAWSRVLNGALEVERANADAGRAFEVALQLDPTRQDLRKQFARFLGEWIAAAERGNRRTERQDLLSRLAIYDDDGGERQRLLAPARVRIASSPAGATVSLERYEADESGRRKPIAARELGPTPIETGMEPGSYRLVLRSPGRVEVLYPLLAAAGERLELEIPLPRVGEIPPGFVFVPAGRFLFGSNEESIRFVFLNTMPQHERTTGPFLIARHEVTFGDWIQYLDELPEEQRLHRTPRPGDIGVRGTMELAKRDGRWMLTIKPGERTYTARAGERVLFPGRKVRQEQDWLRFPVALISGEDADAYARWLAETGRVPGARLCSEVEWERAARGADDRLYPHGDYLAPEDASFDETYEREPLAIGYDEVGSHPASSSPFGVDDLAGNVFEWTRPSIGGAFIAGGMSVTSGTKLVGRGGSWLHDRRTALMTNRSDADASFRDMTVGMRLCADYPAHAGAGDKPGAEPGH